MNIETLFAQMIPDLKVVGVKFLDCTGSPMGKTYHYKSMLEGIEVGDTVVANTPSVGLTCARVVEVLDATALQTNSIINYTWLVQKVDLENYQKMLANDEKVKQTVRLAAKAASLRKAQKEFQKLLEDAGMSESEVGDVRELLNFYKG